MQQKLTQLFSLRLWMLLATLVGGVLYAKADTTGKIIFGSASGSTNINGVNITGSDSESKSWTITTVGTTSFTPTTSYAQIGSSKNPATSITFTSTITDNDVEIKAISANFGGFSGTTGTITIKVGDTSVGTGSLNATSNVTVNSTQSATGKVITITVTGIAKGVKAYNISYTYAPPKTATTLSINKTSTTLTANGDTETLTATVTSTSGVALVSPSITWTSSNETVATVVNGVVTPLKEGSTTITASYAGDETYDASSSTCTVTVNDGRTPVNLSTFTATNTTLIAGGSPSSTATNVTNDQGSWSAAYTYSSSNEGVATVNASGVITAVAKGTATITCSVNVDAEDENYKAGTTTNLSIEITVNNPSHTVTFSANGSTYGEPASVEEGEDITFPASTPSDVNGFSFVGWLSETIDGTTDDEPTFVTEATMSTTDLTYYAVYADADISYSESEIEKTQTLEYDTWTYSGSTTNKTTYRLFHNGSYVESAAFDLSLLKKVVVKGGTFGGGGYNTLTIGDGTNTWKNVTVSGSSETGDNEYTGGTALSGTKALRVQSTCGSSSGGGTGVRISKVEIYTKKRTATYSDYCTTVSALPIPVITMDDVTMTWGETGKSVAPSATIGEEAYDGSFTFLVNDDALTVASNGVLTCDTPGEYTVTASIAATAEHQAASTTCNVTVQKKAVTLSFANATVRKNTSDATYTQTATVSPAAYDGTISYSKEDSSTSTGATVNSATAAVAFSNTGSVIVKASASATDLYNAATQTYTILVQTDPTISVSDQSVAYGKTYTLDTSSFRSGDVTISSSNSHIASIDDLVITAAAVGTATITVTAAESDTYTATTETFTFTVTAPTAASSSSEAKEEIFYESFDKCGTNGGNDGIWDPSGSGTVSLDNSWTRIGSFTGANKCIKMSSGKSDATLTTPVLSTTAGVTYTLTFKAGAWKGKSSTLSLSGNKASSFSETSISLEAEKFNNYIVTFNATDINATVTFFADKENQLFLDEVRIFRPITSTSVTTSGGLATYCYQYPLDLDGISGAKAYVVSNVDVENSRVTLTQITGSIKGGVPFILKSDGDDATFDIPLADESTDEPASNMLVGTLAPTFVEQTSGDDTNFAYSKSNGCFVKLGAAGNTVPANRAYLPINLGSGSVKSFTLSFDITDGIDGTQAGNGKSSDGTCYTLTGQRLAKPQRGINIVGGRKVIIK